MSLCDRCSSPGSCCKRIPINGEGDDNHFTVWHVIDPVEDLAERGGAAYARHPFRPLEPRGTWIDPATGAAFSSWLWSCVNLTPSGRCGDYENRPPLCRDYAPAQDSLCAMHPTPRPAP